VAAAVEAGAAGESAAVGGGDADKPAGVTDEAVPASVADVSGVSRVSLVAVNPP